MTGAEELHAEVGRLERILTDTRREAHYRAKKRIAERKRLTELADQLAKSQDVGHWTIAEQIREAMAGEEGHPDD